ncbi:MAG TPA: hypothetical protein PLT89_11030 [Syntrophomonadaceae bacterium]|jgi:hypothetical protein|nr:hypothetical protein [Syntrophomonadaceae bacterium]
MGRIPAGFYPYESRITLKQICADEKGVLLVDLLASLALGLAVLTLVVNILVVMQTSNRQLSDHAELLYAGQVVQQVLQNEVRNALEVKVINGGQTLLVTNATGGVTSFYSSGSNFYRYYITASPIAENVKSLHFYQKDSCLWVNIDLQKGREQLQISFACALRCE